jgi:macrolide transport system ATP-binding/permease protein
MKEPAMKAFWRRLRARIRHRHFAADLDEELAFHRDMKKDALARAGVDNADDLATRSAHEMGNTTLAREAARGVWIAPWIDSVRQDLVYAARSLRRQPAFTVATLAALIVAIGLNTSLFTAYYALALRPWAVADPWRVVMLFDLRANGFLNDGLSLAEYRYLRDHAHALSGLIAKHQREVVIGDDEAAQRVSVAFVNSNYFDVLGVRTAVGRTFLADEDRLGAPLAVCVIGYGLWQGRFGGDPGAVGRTLRVNDTTFTIVGVIASDFKGTGDRGEPLLWIPLAAMPLAFTSDPTSVRDLLEKPSACCASIAGRLALGVTREQAQLELDQLSRLFRQSVGQKVTHPAVLPTRILAQNKGNGAMVVFALMFTCTTLVLLLACANVGNLCVARALARQHEIAVRLSLGASRPRVIRQLLTESLLLAVTAGTIGIGIAFFLPNLLTEAAFPGVRVPDLSPDWMLLAFTCGLCALACLLFGLAPAIRGTRLGTIPLADSSTGSTRAIGTGFALRGLLLATQLAISLILLVGATLLARGVQRVATQDPGFAIDDVAVASLELPARGFDRPRTAAFAHEFTTALRARADLRSAALTMFEPLASGRVLTSIRLPGEAENRTRTIEQHLVSPEYFDVLEIPLVAGRGFTPGDVGGGVALVNQTMARELWPNDNPIGRTIIGAGGRRPGAAPSATEIIGVVRDAYTSGLDRVEPVFYKPLPPPDVPFQPRILLKQRPSAAGAAGPAGAAGSARSAGATRATGATGPAAPTGAAEPAVATDLAGAATALRALVHSLDPRVGVKVEPLRANFDRWLTASRVGAAIAGAVALLALVLAAIGVFGVFAFVVQARTQEIGLRMALGARPHQVVALVMRSTAWATLGGLGVGAIGAFAGSRFLVGQLYGVSPSDPAAYITASALLAIAAAAATFLPARRATRIDPIAALRRE